MTQTLGIYNPMFYAQEALIQLEKALGMAARVHRGYDAERRAFGKGDVINIRRPSTFTAGDAPVAATDLSPETVQITLNKWREVKFKLTDKELTISEQRIIDDHIRPAAYALADDIDAYLFALYTKIPWSYDLNSTPGSVVTDLTGPRKVMRDNKVPLDDESMIHFMVGSTLEANLLGNSAFTQWSGAGDTGVQSQLRGTIGTRFGMNVFATHNIPSHTPGVCADAAGAIDNSPSGYAIGDTTVHIDGVTSGGTLVVGDILTITGDTQKYVVTENVTMTSGEGDVKIYPALKKAAAHGAVATFTLISGEQNLLFHRNAFALAMAPLSPMGNELGARIASITDPISGLAIRSRVYYIPDSSVVGVALDVLYGASNLDPNLAVRCY